MSNVKLLEQTLKAKIVNSLKAGEMIEGFEDALFIKSKGKLRIKDETQFWDYKEDIDFDNPFNISKLAKRVIGFHNSKGGVLIFGISDNYRVIGFSEKKALDSVGVKNKIKKYTGASVSIFQGRIPLSGDGKIIWLIFVPPRTGLPLSIQKDGPKDSVGISNIKKGQYYIRVHDETKLCVDPNDYERLFTGTSFTHLHAYAYEVDEPYFRLLAPHHVQFIGRRQLVRTVIDALSPENRGYIFSLEGVGGVGKSAVAIQAVQKLYKAGKFSFIVSMSAKNRVWHTYIESRQAGFSGFTELIKGIASVLQIDTKGKSSEEIKFEVMDFMKGVDGLLFLDNIEDISDPAVFRFIKNIPPPVKVLLTSRVERYSGLPVEEMFVNEMTNEEAENLLEFELDRTGYLDYLDENKDFKDIIKASGQLPLLIKWAASLANSYKSLRKVSQEMRKNSATTEELLEFCYATMYNELSHTAQNVAQLCPYLGRDWNIFTLSIALEESEENIEKAINELEDKGLLSQTMPSHEGAFSMLPLTLDFLTNKSHQNQTLRDTVDERISEALETSDGKFFFLPPEEKIKILYPKAKKYLLLGDYERAGRATRLALQYSTENGGFEAERLSFLEGKIIYESKSKKEGIARMDAALNSNKKKISDFGDEYIFFAQALLLSGKRSQENYAMHLVIDNINDCKTTPIDVISRFCSASIRRGNYRLLSDLVKSVKGIDNSYWLAKDIKNYLNDSNIVFTLGFPLVELLRRASNSELSSASEKDFFLSEAKRIEQIFQTITE